jgi:hypothetical protein
MTSLEHINAAIKLGGNAIQKWNTEQLNLEGEMEAE